MKTISALLLSTVCTAACLPALAWETPTQALQQFLEADAQGMRLQSGMDFDKFYHLDASLAADYDEPGWDSITLIDSYTFTPLQCKAHVCSTKVTFRLTPTATVDDASISAHPTGGSKHMAFTIKKHQNQWRIVPTEQEPHVRFDTYQALRAAE